MKGCRVSGKKGPQESGILRCCCGGHGSKGSDGLAARASVAHGMGFRV